MVPAAPGVVVERLGPAVTVLVLVAVMAVAVLVVAGDGWVVVAAGWAGWADCETAAPVGAAARLYFVLSSEDLGRC